MPDVFRLIVQDGGITKLGEEDLEVACVRERMGELLEGMMESQADSYVARILTAVNMEGSFSFPESQEGNNLVVEPQLSARVRGSCRVRLLRLRLEIQKNMETYCKDHLLRLQEYFLEMSCLPASL